MLERTSGLLAVDDRSKQTIGHRLYPDITIESVTSPRRFSAIKQMLSIQLLMPIAAIVLSGKSQAGTLRVRRQNGSLLCATINVTQRRPLYAGKDVRIIGCR